MRIPIPIAITSCVIATGATWYFSTQQSDVTTPPTADQKTEITAQWKLQNSSGPEKTPLSPDLKSAQIEKAAPQKNAPQKKSPPSSKPTPLPMGDLKQSPHLSEYGTLADQGTEAMILLAIALESKGAKERARLAWERVLDTTKPTAEEVIQAGKAIAQLSTDLPPWNPDPTSDITITLHAGSTLKDKKALEQALKTTATIINEASGHILNVQTKISVGKGDSPKTPRIPIAIWFSRASKSTGGTDAETPPLSFMADPSEEKMLTSQCQAGVYALLRSHLAEETSYSNLPEYPAGVKPDELLKYHVTRLMWREFVNSLKAASEE